MLTVSSMMISTFGHLSAFEAFLFRFDLSGKCNNEAMKEELEEKRRAQVFVVAILVCVHF
jgi:hypothetical protein